MATLVAPLRLTDQGLASSLPQSRCKASRDAHEHAAQHQPRTLRLTRKDREDSAARLLQYSGRMMAVARRMLRCEEDAADAVQDALTSAFASIDRFRATAQLYTWLHRIVVNACLMKLRSQKRRAALSLDALLPSFDENGNHAHPVSPWPNEAIEQI